ncbi:MAG: prepilin-type N-terminal cleavage/methylation domain-containing protein [Candidatus Eisenbacteria bacterium]|nr:prepilin-type N-terminal cleavage/methylation domain-containing protein [Candidatus Eisenbacteria bacterium]
MRRRGKRPTGFTLVEVVIATAILGILAVGLSRMVQSQLQVRETERSVLDTYREGRAAMARMTRDVRVCTQLMIPNGHNPTRDILAVAGFHNDDDDYYFNDILFPRVDEDPKNDVGDDGKPGIKGYDDDGDGWIDMSGNDEDDDEDYYETYTKNEDPVDGFDNDHDGTIDEDYGADINNDYDDGINGWDDDGDGGVDNGEGREDDDEDDKKNEDPVDALIFQFNPDSSRVEEVHTWDQETGVLCDHVTGFSTVYYYDNYYTYPYIEITLTLTADNGRVFTFSERVYPENTVQKIGRRVY